MTAKDHFSNVRVFTVCAKGKQSRSLFKFKNEVSTSRPIELIHIDICDPVKVQSVVDDYLRYIWLKFLWSKDEAMELLMALIKHV